MKILIALSLLVALSGCNADGNKSAAKQNEASYGFIQLIATRDESKAEKIRKAFADDGYNASIQKGSSLNRVRIVDFASKQDAEEGLAKMKARYAQNPLVQNAQAMAW